VSTLSERILGAPAGTYVDREVDIAFAHDGTGLLTREVLCGFLRQAKEGIPQ